MTLLLPDRNVEPGGFTDAGTLERVWRGVQQNFQFLSSVFPLGQLFTAADGTVQSALTGLLFAEFPQVRAYKTADQVNVPTATWTAVTFTAENYDKGTPTGMHDNAVNTTRLTCRVPGLYAVSANVTWAANAVGSRGARLILNGGAGPLAEVEMLADVAGNFTQINVNTQWRFVVGDYVEVEAEQTSGGNLNILLDGAQNSTYLAAAWLSV